MDLFKEDLQIALKRLKLINKEKYRTSAKKNQMPENNPAGDLSQDLRTLKI